MYLPIRGNVLEVSPLIAPERSAAAPEVELRNDDSARGLLPSESDCRTPNPARQTVPPTSATIASTTLRVATSAVST